MSEIEELKAEVERLRERVAELEQLNTELLNRQDDLWGQVKEKAQEIDRLESMIIIGTSQKQRIAELEADKDILHAQIAVADSKLEDYQKRIAELEDWQAARCNTTKGE